MELHAVSDAGRQLLDAMKALGLSDPIIHALAREVENQLNDAPDGRNITEILDALDAPTFVRRVDVSQVAQHVGIPRDIARDAVAMLAPEVAEFRHSEVTS